jgi:DNA-binding SARP family transcriptional activator
MHISLFGNLRIEVAGKPITSVNTNRLQSLLAYLILHGDAPQSRDRLAFTLWPASRESQARTNLRQLIHGLKRM